MNVKPAFAPNFLTCFARNILLRKKYDDHEKALIIISLFTGSRLLP